LRVAEPARVIEVGRDGLVVDLPGLGPTAVGLRGRHQAHNVALADAMLDGLAASGIASPSADARRRGYRVARWPGRLELVQVDGRDVLLDGAHNPDGAATLAAALDDLRPHLGGDRTAPVTLVMAAMADKDVDGIIRSLVGAASLRGGRIVCTQVGLSRALPADALARKWTAARGAVSAVRIRREPIEALGLALAEAEGPVVVAGSLYLVGALRAHLVKDPLLQDPPP
jgi:dihydrofolate synthase/folylpolyglutamate synthase